MDTIPS